MSKIETIGILYAGEMGAAVGRLLSEDGLNVVTTCENRSPRTHLLCREAGLRCLDSLSEVVSVSDLLISLVSPASALPVAQEICELARRAGKHPIYLDANSISPATAQQIDALLQTCEIDLVDGGIHGLASRLVEQGTLYLSGARASEIVPLFSNRLRVEVLGDSIGQASALKMMLGGLSKGVAALFIELGVAASQAGLRDELLREYRRYYPALMEFIERVLPTYPQHARRRGEEMQELETMLLALGQSAHMAHGAKRTIAAIGTLDLNEDRGREEWNVEDVIEAIHAKNRLQREK